MGKTAKIGLIVAMVAVLFAGQLVERIFAQRRRDARASHVAVEYEDLLKPLPDASLPGARGARGGRGRGPGGGPPTGLASAPDGSRVYVIQPGDTLGKIAGKVYGSEAAWRPIFDRNRPSIPDPARLKVGTTLQIPAPPAPRPPPREKPPGRPAH